MGSYEDFQIEYSSDAGNKLSRVVPGVVPDSDENSSSDDHKDTNLGWSDSVANILKSNSRKGTKTLVLAKAKKKTIIIETTKLIPTGYEVATESGEIKAQHVEKVLKTKEQPHKKLKNDFKIRMKPSILEKDRERILAKIATKGVVQLFNAVKMQQKDISAKISQAGPLQGRQEKAIQNIDKRNFLNILMGKKSESVVEEGSNALSKEVSDSSWNILKDEYLMSAKLKDWDRQLENEVEME